MLAELAAVSSRIQYGAKAVAALEEVVVIIWEIGTTAAPIGVVAAAAI